DRKPRREVPEIRIAFTPVADAKGDNPAKEQTLVRNRIEDNPERAALIVPTSDITIDAVTGSGQEENNNCSEALPFQRRAPLDTFTVIDPQRYKHRDH